MVEGVEFRQRVMLGGFAQEVSVRGAEATNPLLLILHGGPGLAEMPLFATYNSELEDHFLVAHWDQRGAGRSYDAGLPAESMTLRQFVADAIELIDVLTEHFGQEKVYLLGHSWGTLFGAMVASEYPEKVHAYIGAGQLVAGRRAARTSYEFTVRKAIEQHNDEAIAALRQIEERRSAGGLTFAELTVQRGWLNHFGGTVNGSRDALFARIEPELQKEYFGELRDVAQEFSFGHLMQETLATDLQLTARTFEVPIHLCVGRYDQVTPTEQAVEYFEAIEAPSKQLHWFENSAHFMPFEEAAKFNALMAGLALENRSSS
ncbi:alpha/beta hydrolase [Streptomyces sp. SID13031]|uniref:alpha/beta fold hydrolase n=1 Tax=Streptomyces sp. SID13031 TaxID=2706046 RepID=UPI0013CB7472|nr:alpha/beta hydrolase [Streptomyces sp. SID13031]NEA33971.1 alpha/beta hydrolase [Streptomyces sp. SID13031]